MQFFSVLDADGELAREKDAHMTGNPDSDSDSEGQREGEERRLLAAALTSCKLERFLFEQLASG